MFYNRTYFDKCATIIRGSKVNTGFNPVSDLVYGRNLSRTLFHFDHNKIKTMVEDKTFPDMSKLRHILRITNAGSLDLSELHKVYGSQIDGAGKKRASSFDLIFFLIPREWDNGKGFDYTKDSFNIDFYDKNPYEINNYMSEDGVNWFHPVNGYAWKESIPFQETIDEQLTFFIKSDKTGVGAKGGDVTFTYMCGCNGGEANLNLELKVINQSLTSPVKIGTPIHYSASGQICYTEADIRKYGKYVKVITEIPENDLDATRKFAFRLESTINGKTYKSNPYKITQVNAKEYVYPLGDDGIYSSKTLEEQLNLFELDKDSIVIGKQHFDVGCENVHVDITDTVNKFITGELENHGIGIAFSPTYEYTESDTENYIGLLTNRTNSFFEPFVETIYTDSIKDDRDNFVLGRDNKLYMYANIGGDLQNLDEMPTCTINEEPYRVKQAGKGMYYVNVRLAQDTFSSPTMLYDAWDNLKYKGEALPPIELEFTTQPANSFFQIGSSTPDEPNFTPTAYGIRDGEEIKRGDVRKVCLMFKKDYSKNINVSVENVEIRLYVKDGTAQVNVIPYMETNRALHDTYFLIDTSILIPNTYYMDVRVKYGMEMIEHHEVLKFTIVNEENNRYA